jgi:periplasmic divalent cation tolerance protein
VLTRARPVGETAAKVTMRTQALAPSRGGRTVRKIHELRSDGQERAGKHGQASTGRRALAGEHWQASDGQGGTMGLCMLYTTWPDRATALAAAETLISESLAACCNVLGESLSVYRWEGVVRRENECVMLVKTAAARVSAASARLAELHPYDTPAIIALGVDDAQSHAGYRDWAAGQMAPMDD